MSIGETGAPKQMMPPTEKTQEEKETIFEKLIERSEGTITIKREPENLFYTITFYQNNKNYGVSIEDPAMQKYSEEFRRETGCEIDEFLAYYEKRKAEEAQKNKETIQE